MAIESIEIQPCTQGTAHYNVGGCAGPYPYKRKVTEIKVITETNETFIQIFVDNQLYVEYANVPYAIFYKLDENPEKQK